MFTKRSVASAYQRNGRTPAVSRLDSNEFFGHRVLHVQPRDEQHRWSRDIAGESLQHGRRVRSSSHRRASSRSRWAALLHPSGDPTKPGVVATKYGLLDPNSTRGGAADYRERRNI